MYLGTDPFLLVSYSSACRRALAKALKVASMMWWELVPASCKNETFANETIYITTPENLRFILILIWGLSLNILILAFRIAQKIISKRTRSHRFNNRQAIKNGRNTNVLPNGLLNNPLATFETYLANMEGHSRRVHHRLEKMLHQLHANRLSRPKVSTCDVSPFFKPMHMSANTTR